MGDVSRDVGEVAWWTVAIDGAHEAALRALAHQAIRNGRLPRRNPDRTSCSNGVGTPCSICGKPVTPDHVSYKIQYDQDGRIPGCERLQLHLRCFAAWEMERTKL
jgi:hypothetical protein